jgi:hypothetical protein
MSKGSKAVDAGNLTSVSADIDLAMRLEDLSSDERWMFRPWTSREYSHGLFQYPAMMVPQMQRELLECIRLESGGESVFDGFVGSGTTMAEAMLQGLDFIGVDINPLAVLLCRAKRGPFFIHALEEAADRVSQRATADSARTIEIGWKGWRKWFRQDVALGLSRLRRSIRREPVLSTRRFMWVALAETVRLSSNSRTSTVKLHVRTPEDRSRRINVLKTFEQIVEQNLDRFDDQRRALAEKDLLAHGHYTGQVDVELKDISSEPSERAAARPCQILLTSPPYGDNATTVPYGQHAFLPLQWIDLADIDPNADQRFLASTHAIDSMSLGAPTRGALEQVEPLRVLSPALDATLNRLEKLPRDRPARVAAFWRDLDAGLANILAGIDDGALMAWTVGNRRVGGHEVPMDSILRELLEHRGCTSVTSLAREIPDCRKRMASRNSIAATMNAEQVLVLRAPVDGDG